MTVTNSQSGTHVHEVADGIFRIGTPVVPLCGTVAAMVSIGDLADRAPRARARTAAHGVATGPGCFVRLPMRWLPDPFLARKKGVAP